MLNLNLKSKAPSTKDNVEYDFNLCRHIGLSKEWGPIYNKHFGRSIDDLAKAKVERNSDGSGDYASGIPGTGVSLYFSPFQAPSH